MKETSSKIANFRKLNQIIAHLLITFTINT